MKFYSAFVLGWCSVALFFEIVYPAVGQDLSDPDLKVMLVDYETEHMAESYRFKYATDDGQTREEMGLLMNPGTPNEELVVVGMYGYETFDGVKVMVMYVSGKKGYRTKTKTRLLANSERNRKLLRSLVG
ncbi:uncharacterized protein LOC131688286 [Topomyia yanbarensis]|uniref:uncharacterized protein LOC131688286 n=1 Tax=Topomyia yanbarensis TaxID=2498891 RepID=UPI00273C84DA|nr:uncharacterized protein LOC131688286 [Topomyia yanbarensis]